MVSSVLCEPARAVSRAAGSATNASSPHTAPQYAALWRCLGTPHRPGRADLGDWPVGSGRRAERRGLRCVVFDIRAGGASVTPRAQFRSHRLSQARFQHLLPGVTRGISRRRRPLAVAATLGLLAVTLSGCSWSEALGLGWPEGITPQAHVNRQLWIGSVIASLVVGVIVWGLIFWSAAFHRKKATDTELPRQFGYNMPLELVLTVVPFLIISVLFYFTVVVQEKMLYLASDPEVVIDVTAFQWNWKFGYQKVDFKDGTLKYY